MENNKDIRRKDRLEKLQALEKWISEEEPRTKIIIGEDFNARTGREEGEVTEMGKKRLKESGRQSRDRKINREDKLLVDFIEEREWMILNGNTKKGEEEEYMFTGGSRMYGNRLHIRRWRDKEMNGRNKGRGQDSDCQSVEVTIKEREREREK